MFDRPWVRLVLGALAAALLGAMAARVAVSAGDGAGAGAGGATAGRSSGSGGSGGGSGGSGGGGSGPAGASGSGGTTASVAPGDGRLTIHVTGEVRRPGVYALTEGARVDDAVRRAGGVTADGDRQGLNLAAPVRDGQQVRVPSRVVPAAGGAGTGGGAAGGAGPGGPAAPVDLNTATLEELQTLDGVGPTTAQKIVQLREERGGLAGVDDLDEVPGIGAKKLEALRAQLEP